MTVIKEDWLQAAPSQQIMTLLEAAGHRAYFVGGCVRNALLGMPVSDIDIATDALPETVMSLAEDAGLKAVPTGISHGTVTLIADEEPFEVTTFRKDIETYGRHAKVLYTDKVEEDAHRRDFTMNALYADGAGKVIDPLGGLQDLFDRKLRFIDDPQERIREDFLRILRFFRFHAWYADPENGLDQEGLSACAHLAAGLEGVSKERIGGEIRKLLAAPDPSKSLGAMQQSGVLAQVLPGSDPRAAFLVISSHPVDPVLRLAALGGEDPTEHLRLSKADSRRIDLLRAAAESAMPGAEIGYRLGERDAIAALHLRAAHREQAPDPEAIRRAQYGAVQQFPIRAADLMPAVKGAALGSRLEQLEQAWIDSDFHLTKAELLRL